MCDLFGMTFSIPVTARISMDIFQLRGEANPDGWGLAFYNEGGLQIVKEAMSAIESSLFDFIEGYPISKTFISHVRRSTFGVRSYMNTHPFYRQINAGSSINEWAFAHNGTFSHLDTMELNSFKPIGETDSEHIFCHLLDWIREKQIKSWSKSEFSTLEEKLRTINESSGTLNCMLTNGELLFCYSDNERHNGGLRFLPQASPFGTVDLIHRDERLGTVDIQSANIGSTEEHSEIGYIIVTRALTKDDWIEFQSGELIVFHDGHIIYPDDRRNQTIS